ncbi:MAG: endonuclease/exonuclease/phosphatase family protein [Gammaproteobacteria bacterium]|nr:endonuclease/exonuclease/phosphatase family protein [Gammaproteobacteria bacterium]
MWRDRFNNLLLIAAGALLAATLAGFAGEYWWFLELFVHFRIHFAAAAALLAAAFVVTRGLTGGLLSLLCLLLNGVPIMSFLGQTAPKVTAQSKPLKIVSANISNATSGNGTRIAAFIREEKPDVLLLIELTAPMLQELQSVLNEAYPYRYSLPRPDYFGIGVFSRHRLQDQKLLDLGYLDVPAISVRVVTGQASLRLVGIHLEWPVTPSTAAGRNRQLDNLSLRMNDVDEPLILIGDFNTTRWASRFGDLVAATGLRDTATGFGWQPTWPTFLPNLGIAIDHCLVSPALQVRNHRPGPDIGSDHYPLIVELSL